MPLMTERECGFVQAVSKLVLGNPFLPERIEAEREALGPEFVATGRVWHARLAPEDANPNVVALTERVAALVEALRERLAGGARARQEELGFYEELAIYFLYDRYLDELHRLVTEPGTAAASLGWYPTFARDADRYLGLPGLATPDPGRLLALFFQVRRAFHFTFRNILGGSLPAARLRAAVWQAIFTRDMRRYRRALYDRMHDVPTLIAGPSGTGKELVARAIGLSRYIPFDAARRAFVQDFTGAFYPLNISALPATLIESELFGHRRGAFTGAVQDRPGCFEVCPPLGTVFLDEIAEVEASIQVKLLRVLQTRGFQRIGDTQERRFQGKIVAATNRNLAVELQAGRFRADLYYRLCADMIETPSLQALLADAPQELPELLRFIAARVAGDAEADALAAEAESWITKHLGRDYPWPGNVRELEQCVRNIMVRGEYRPPAAWASAASPREELAAALQAGTLSAEELVRRYCTVVFARTGSYQETARRLGIDRRTVKEKIDPALLERIRPPAAGAAS